MIKSLYYVANALYIFSFISNQCAMQNAPNEEELDPDTDDDGISSSDSELADSDDNELETWSILYALTF